MKLGYKAAHDATKPKTKKALKKGYQFGKKAEDKKEAK